MHYDVVIVTDEKQQFIDLKEYASKILKNVNITLYCEDDDINDVLEYTDLVIIDINVHNNFSIYEESLEKNIHTIFLVDSDIHLKKFSIIEKEDILYKPLDLDKLILKIKYYTNIISKKLVEKKEEEFSNSIINNINYPIFSVDQEKVIFSNDHFFKLLNCNSIEEINSKYKNIKDIFEKEKGCVSDFTDTFDEIENKNIKV
jgi:hypothetical protein